MSFGIIKLMKKKNLWIIVALLVIVVILGVVLNIRDEKNKNTVKIGVLTPMSGPMAIAGEVQKNAFALALKDGHNSKIELIYEDSKYDPKTSISGYEALKMKGVKIIIADGSPVVSAIREKAVNDGIMVFAQSATTPMFSDESPLTCRVGLTADILGSSISEYVKNSLQKQNIALLAPGNEYGRVMTEEVGKYFKMAGGNVIASEIYDQASGDLRTNILKLKEKQNQIDVLVVINNITPEPMFNQLAEMGWNKPIVSDIWTMTSPNLKNKKNASGVKFVDYIYSPQSNLNSDEKAKRYSEIYQEKFNASSILLGALTYDSYNILSKAIDEVGGNPISLAEYFTKMPEYNGITGAVKFDSSCQNINKKLVWRKVNSDGTFSNL